jgi:hypothetical protein
MNSWSFASAFERNCPSVRLNDNERAELARLFAECSKWARTEARRMLLDELKGHVVK